ncbi:MULTISPECIES: SUMF1/EgtB/PvdO family nonheme iron enzyme [Pseudanabaena]|uniref:Sulphatase-modifying factor protein n=2 Tax=Pseudanabaena TaxID=1152 RepID=L8MZS9_9CYAN|nr:MULTISPECIES: SUMF1/EgtB/PvdO family nonheme iron enzyme [Pseudanabaena]ELS33487.1 Sulphatase-modifying factor protein [Pseudanabaena biceps PCC 7429]MDG3494295.1 SUMF1/EgtB/PvdO family nonheme iron enzyme [Pseudanabaena catenata USMAC16]
MANWAIAIGVNQYEFLHPLKYAKNDALYICDFLKNEAKFDRIFYFSDDSPDLDGRTTKPFRNNLLRVFNGLANKPLHDSDNFWFFFAGHGILEDGIDYLMPSDGDPDNIANTGIAVNQVIQNLRGSGAGNVILALDACRNQVRRNVATRSGEGIGRETEREAKIADVISISACSPTEYSYEVDNLKHGAFTYALVEGLGVQGRCATAAKLNTYLKHRVPELAKTRQTPRMMLDPQEKGHLILMPKYADKFDLEPLKKDAFKAHRDRKLDLARRLWMQILAVDGTDYEAITEIEGLAVERYLGTSPQVTPSPVAVETGTRNVSKSPEPNPLILDLGNGITLELVRVSAGKFKMGSNEYDSEKPIHEVQLKEFLIGKYTVTNAQWQALMKTKGSANCDKKFQGDLQPVVGVSWHEARAFCVKLSQQTGREVRLPTEAEWEYAARGANQSKGFTYAGSNNLGEVAWYNDNSGSVTHPVGQKKANELDIYDMSGNVWEWCLDEWHGSYADKPENLKKQGNLAWGDLNIDNNDNRSRLLRGGSWGSVAGGCRAAVRDRNFALLQVNDFGFRVLLVSSS